MRSVPLPVVATLLGATLTVQACSRDAGDAASGAAATNVGSTVVARIGNRSIEASAVDRSIAGPLHELEYERYLLRREALESLLLTDLAAAQSGERSARILLHPPLPPVTELTGEPAALRPDAPRPVTITVFCNFESPHCAQVQSTLADVLALYPSTVRLAARDLPLSMHPLAPLAARAARCAARQQRYWSFHDLLWARGQRPTRSELALVAGATGLDRDAFDRCLEDGTEDAAVGADVALARRLGLGLVPAVFVNGRLVSTPVTPDRLLWLVESELRRRGSQDLSEPSAPLSTLPIEVRATVVGELPGLGLALLDMEGRSRVVREGDRVASNAILRRVSQQGAELLVEGRAERLSFESRQVGTVRGEPDSATGQATGAHVPPVLPAAKGAMPVYLDRDVVRERMADRVELATHLEPVPMTVDGYRLLRLEDVPEGSLYELLGLQPGDVVVAVNERAIHEGDNPLWDALDREQEVRVRVMRRGGLAHHYTYRFE